MMKIVIGMRNLAVWRFTGVWGCDEARVRWKVQEERAGLGNDVQLPLHHRCSSSRASGELQKLSSPTL